MSAWRTMADAGRTRLQTLPHDTFRGRVCRCPVVGGVQFVGDGYTQCEASGALHCEINNGGCWKKTQNGKTYSACVVRNYMVINSVTAPQDSREMESKLAKRYMDSEIRAIMVQYMPLDNHGEPANHLLRRNILALAIDW